MSGLQIFKDDGSLIFDSEKYKPLKYKMALNVVSEINFVTNSNWTSAYYVGVTYRIPASERVAFLFIPYLNITMPCEKKAYDYIVYTTYSFDTNVNRDVVKAKINTPCFILEV